MTWAERCARGVETLKQEHFSFAEQLLLLLFYLLEIITAISFRHRSSSTLEHYMSSSTPGSRSTKSTSRQTHW
jgi:hypothetical protein